jgi:hypothetical protein
MVDQATRETIAPVRKSIVVPWSVEVAFRRFTAEIGTWWPLRSHSLGQKQAVTCVFEGREGGKIYEVLSDGRRSEWWERLGRTARKTRNGYNLGWSYVLRRWAGQPPTMLDRVLNALAAIASMVSRRSAMSAPSPSPTNSPPR